MKTGNNRKYLLIFSGVLLAYQYLGLVIDGNIPYTQIKTPIKHIYGKNWGHF
jgi:hypothetical protein